LETCDDPYRIQVEEVELLIDLGAEQVLAAERMGEKIAVEIKTLDFLQKSGNREQGTGNRKKN
jgi:hypothetical protein